MDNSSKAVDVALKRLDEVRAAHAASRPFTHDRLVTTFAGLDAEREYCAALRAERKPRADCSRCERRIKPGQPMVWQWRHGQSVPLCLRCHRTKKKGDYAPVGRISTSGPARSARDRCIWTGTVGRGLLCKPASR